MVESELDCATADGAAGGADALAPDCATADVMSPKKNSNTSIRLRNINLLFSWNLSRDARSTIICHDRYCLLRCRRGKPTLPFSQTISYAPASADGLSSSAKSANIRGTCSHWRGWLSPRHNEEKCLPPCDCGPDSKR